MTFNFFVNLLIMLKYRYLKFSNWEDGQGDSKATTQYINTGDVTTCVVLVTNPDYISLLSELISGVCEFLFKNVPITPINLIIRMKNSSVYVYLSSYGYWSWPGQDPEFEILCYI